MINHPFYYEFLGMEHEGSEEILNIMDNQTPFTLEVIA